MGARYNIYFGIDRHYWPFYATKNIDIFLILQDFICALLPIVIWVHISPVRRGVGSIESFTRRAATSRAGIYQLLFLFQDVYWHLFFVAGTDALSPHTSSALDIFRARFCAPFASARPRLRLSLRAAACCSHMPTINVPVGMIAMRLLLADIQRGLAHA